MTFNSLVFAIEALSQTEQLIQIWVLKSLLILFCFVLILDETSWLEPLFEKDPEQSMWEAEG